MSVSHVLLLRRGRPLTLSNFLPRALRPFALASQTPLVQPRRMTHNDRVRLQFPPLPPAWVDKYKPGQMYRSQAALPKLPVPPLQQTLEKYLASVEPLLTPEELQRTRVAVAEFGKVGGAGEKLQEKLLERARTHDNWLADWWSEVAYLGHRLPVVVHSSPAIGYPKQAAGDTETYLRTATKHLLALVKWQLLIQHESIPPDMYRNKPMCMSQYDMYSSCRIPAPSVDKRRKTPLSESRHILVMRNGHIFKLEVLGESPSGELAVVPSSHIIRELRNILDAAQEPASDPVGVLTSEHRDTWCQARERLVKDPVNRASLDVIEQAQFTLCLDTGHNIIKSTSGHEQVDSLDSHSTIIANRTLHGNGTRRNSCNRWWDSAIQIVAGDDGGFGSILEHSAADGPPAIASTIFAMDLLFQQKHDILSETSPVPQSVLRPAEKLDWNIVGETVRDIEAAKTKMDSLAQDVDLIVYAFTEFGKNLPKSHGLSPDGFIQIAIQLAYYKYYQKTSAMYESGATRWYLYGRTDTIRSTTNASHTFLKTMSNPNASVHEKANTIATAIKAHGDYTNEAISGQAVDRHLLGLKILASQAAMATPSIFQDPAFDRSTHFCLSTSQVPVPNSNLFLTFGAVVEDGYGVCYNPQEDQLLLAVSSWHHYPNTDSQLFGSRLAESLREMKDVLVASKGLSSKL